MNLLVILKLLGFNLLMKDKIIRRRFTDEAFLTGFRLCIGRKAGLGSTGDFVSNEGAHETTNGTWPQLTEEAVTEQNLR